MSTFPYLDHRTLAEVDETQRLATEIARRPGAAVWKHRRLRELLAKVPDQDVFPLRPRDPEDAA